MAILVLKAGYLRITHPFATKARRPPFDLHVLGTPPALILSQDQTLQKNLFLFVFLTFSSILIRIVLFILIHFIVISSYIVFKD